ncbi:MAG: DUF4058 family protein [Gemmataceae bacterium]|nr:DUF4058 family protein [Gemmataceae bacterium]
MPLRDHFRPPFSLQLPWDGFHGGLPMMIVLALKRLLPSHYSAQPNVHLGSGIEIDLGTYRDDDDTGSRRLGRTSSEGSVALLSPPTPSLMVDLELPTADEYEVRIYDKDRERRLVAAIEIVSPSNKDRPEHRREFVAKCATLLRQDVSVSIVDIVTVRRFNLYLDLLDFLGQSDPRYPESNPAIYATTLAARSTGTRWSLKTWAYPLEIGQPLPTIPLILADWNGVNLDLEPVYEATLEAVS